MNQPTVHPRLRYHSYIDRVRSMYQRPVAQTSTALTLTLFTISFFGFAAIRPTLGTVSQLVGELEEKRLIDKKITTKLDTLSTAQDQYLQSQDTLAAFDSAIPPQQDLDQFVLSLEYLAIQHQATLTSLRLDPVVTLGKATPTSNKSTRGRGDKDAPPDAFPSLSVKIGVQGDFLSLKAYLETLDNLDRVFQVQSVSFSKPKDPDEQGQVFLNATFKTYWAPEDSQISQAK